MKDELALSDLEEFYGTEDYHGVKPFRTPVTDGVRYIMENGYAWLVTDVLAILEKKYKHEPFVSVKLKLSEVPNDKSVTVTCDDGNGKILHTQRYEYSSAQRNLTLYWEGDENFHVLMLCGER